MCCHSFSTFFGRKLAIQTQTVYFRSLYGNTYFAIQDKFYKQIKNPLMGSFLSTALTNILESNAINTDSLAESAMYMRSLSYGHVVLNNILPKIGITMETEVDNSLLFLDVFVTKPTIH